MHHLNVNSKIGCLFFKFIKVSNFKIILMFLGNSDASSRFDTDTSFRYRFETAIPKFGIDPKTRYPHLVSNRQESGRVTDSTRSFYVGI